MSIEEDYFIPVRAGQSSRIETMSAGANATAIEDIQYLRNKLFAALKIPQSYLSMGEGAEEDKTTLAQKDIRFSRTIQRLQRVALSELEKIGIIHLYTLELQELEHWRAKFDAASAATEGFFSRRWIAEHMFNLSDEEFLRNQREMFYDKKFDATLEAAATAVTEAAAAGAAGDEGLGGDLGGDELGGDELGGGDLGGEDIGADAAPAAEEDEGMLLAEPEAEASPPANRDVPRKKFFDGSHETPGSNGHKYKPVIRSRSRRRQNYLSSAGGTPEINTTRSNILNPFYGLERGLFESKQSNYSMDDQNEENRLFEVNHDIRSLIHNLESKEVLESGSDEN